MTEAAAPIVSLAGLCIGDGRENLVKGIDLEIAPGERLALVGESGSGKSLTASAILGLLPAPLRVTAGTVRFQGTDLAGLSRKERRKGLGARIGCVFQDYRGSFSPYHTVGSQLAEALRTARPMKRKEAKQMALDSLEQVGLPAERAYASYSFQLSGGQLQRAALACVLLLRPELLIADEPTTALDIVSGRSVMQLMLDIQRQTGCGILLISHDLNLVLDWADRAAVMRKGRLVEEGPCDVLRTSASHPYTQELLAACPSLDDALHRHEGGHVHEAHC
ncbi:ABC transporter ATP-binding protein [Paenibacillus pasadenensis]|uniref:ABC transporter ATP-binding protein n=1 Tax=Paenibacillus TaxID=44249 RepID=UPI000693BE3D|nr:MULTISPECIES: ABC transporter ATP-binding protein [Paenibacillus]QGG55221.1 ATP-binding cassette domain-containing protein [Paenibacillus sp. B01]